MNSTLDDVKSGQSKIDQRLKSVETKVSSNETTLSDIKTSLDFQDGRLDTAEENIDTLSASTKQHDTDIDKLKSDMRKLERECNSLERYTRGFNLRFLSIQETPKENCRDKLSALLHDHINITGDVIENAHRTGTVQDTGHRHIIARFHSRIDRNNVIRAARNADPRPPFVVVDDLTPTDITEKRRLSPLMKSLYDAGKRPRFQAGRLYVDGRPLTPTDVDSRLIKLAEDANK